MRRAFYQLLYLNNFIYIEEYLILSITIIALAAVRPPILYGVLVAIIFTAAIFALASPRSPYSIVHAVPASVSALKDNPNVDQPPPLPCLIHAYHGELVDEMGRRVYLRGANVGGKIPLGHTTWVQPPRSGSFIGTLFELNSIDEHLRRLSSACGFTLLRLNITWEAIEPEAEGIYDTAYIAYLQAVVRACGRHGMRVVIDSHQDAWSRWTGGDGAPRWTMERLGMDTAAFPHTRSAMLHCADTGHLTWFTNYTLYGAGTMFALFFGGNRFAPATRVNGTAVQEWLQLAYIRAWCEVAKALVNEPNVLGFEPMNEPNPGWIGLSSLNRLPLPVYMGWDLTPWDSIRLANGDSLDVAAFSIVNAYKRTECANPQGRSSWKPTYTDVWLENGVWGEKKQLLRPGHFALEKGESFETTFLTPFNRRFALAILSFNPRWWIVCCPKLDISTSISAPHWYDNITLVMNRYIPFLALSTDQTVVYPVFASYAHRKALEHLSTPTLSGPFLLGEVGIPWLGSTQQTANALETTLAAVDASLRFSALTLWNYNPRHSQETGDGWNLEDFSIWNAALSFRMPNAVRPYVMVLAGKPVSMQWTPFSKCKTFILTFDIVDDTCSDTSVVFVPEMHYGSTDHLCIWANDGGQITYDRTRQYVEYKHRRKDGQQAGGKNRKRKVLQISMPVEETPRHIVA